MITIRVSADVAEDRRVVLTLPPEVPPGKTELVVSIALPPRPDGPPRTSLAEWAERHAEHWGQELNSTDVESFTGRGVE